MDISQIVRQTKDIILKELFTDVNDKCCVLDLCIENEGTDIKISQWDATKGDFFTPNIQSLSKVSQFFFEKKKLDLINEYNNETILLFRKHNYEKILNQYLENRYDISNLEFSILLSETKKQELEKKLRNQLIRYLYLHISIKQKLEQKNKQELEEKIIKKLPYLKWNKSTENNIIKYSSVDGNGKEIELICILNIQKNDEIVDSRLLCDNQVLEYVKYNVNIIVNKIELCIENEERKKRHKESIKNHEEKIIKKLPYLKWSKFIQTNGIKYSSIYKKRKKIELYFVNTEHENQKETDNKLLYCNQPLKYVDYDINKIVSIIENCIEKQKQYILEHKQELEHKQYEVKQKLYTSLIDIKRQYIENLVKKYGIKQKDIENYIKNYADFYQNKCKYKMSCKLKNKICTVFNRDCPYNQNFLNRINRYIQKILKYQNNNSISKSNKNKPMLTEIGLKDFVVRTNVFKCMHNKHKIDNIVAMINIDNDGKMEQIKISAGYCNECKVYFMLNSTYQALKNKGLILCRITDEKSYLKGNYANGIRLAKESILMQYGYNTSQTNGLSATGRQKILAVIIDNKIMSKSEIISYLDFFINQRSSQARMELAISKWETDREFVENYKIGQYTQFGVNAIYRR
ncbi:MAG: hypothetical protein UE866_04695 [Clostridia bacterium]|jgi:hypothetical protein|nr:hypothetical protein [Clostridia bacterium]